MPHQQRRIHSRLFLDKLVYTGSNTTPTTITGSLFDAKELAVKQYKGAEDLPSLPPNAHLLWIQVSGLGSSDLIAALGRNFSVAPSDMQDILTAEHVTKTSATDSNILLIFRDFYYNDEHELCSEHVCLLLGRNYVMSFQESDRPIFAGVGKALEANTSKVREKSVDYLFGLLLDCVINNYVEITGGLEQALEDMEEKLIDTDRNDGNIGAEILSSRKNIQRMRRSIIPLKEQFPRLIHPDYDLIRKENIGYLVDINDHLQLVVQLLEACREEISSLTDLHIANNDLRLNEIMKRLTVVSTIFIPLTFLVGVWGMNFKLMPELDLPYGYLLAWLTMATIGFATWWYLRRRKWF